MSLVKGHTISEDDPNYISGIKEVKENIYTVNEATENYSWLGAIAILLLLFVLYRNKFQFSGWYKGKGGIKLPKHISFILISISILLIVSPFLLGSLLG
ncbi:hypothetical protein DTX80_06555 [Bacilli bacterium]|nr:hypothetical protein DEJ64_08905 [Bacilli bacterium]PZD87369.1 hypothetical protein DEJ60_08710 [Bacilli bacterium]PZD90880.1 hypothetical protein DEJ66_08350 [Bacilli bacterium]RCO06437.1 hypothetical protein DTX80_06555 [Bacilli bacterium]RCO09891.1 hypothetical protein DTX79_07320 [Bacilli bacterium]